MTEIESRPAIAPGTGLVPPQAVEAERSVLASMLLGNEAADTGDYQVGVRVAHGLGWPCATGIKHLEVTGNGVRARRWLGETSI